MKVSNVTKYNALVEISVDELYRISEALNAAISQHQILDKKNIPFDKEVYQELHEELVEIIANITDEAGNLISA